MRLESRIEAVVGAQLLRWADEEKIELYYLKLNVNNFRGWPDRLILWSDKNLLFVEFKRPGEAPRKLQKYIHRLINSLGFEVAVYDDEHIALAEIKRKILASVRAVAWHGVNSKGRGGPTVSPPR